MIDSIEINNYRSISKCEINTTEIANKSCLILLGKNEAGKSSILKAISLLNPESYFNYNSDCNKTARKMKKSIIVYFNLNMSKISPIFNKINEVGLPEDIARDLNIHKCKCRVDISPENEYSRSIWVYLDDQKHFNDYVYNEGEKVFYTLDSLGIPRDTLTNENVERKVGKGNVLIDTTLIEGLIEDYFAEELSNLLPECIYWQNTNDYLINNVIDLNEFLNNNLISKPLLNIFKISGVKDIKERINLIKDDYEERAQLKDELSKCVTKHINNIWPEHRINIKVEIEGMICTVMVEDQDDILPKYKMEQRSDGFKQFISILLNLTTNDSSGKLILMDEPEVHLHPSGVRFLRDELLRISETNLVLISTHSIYMVDKLNLERHIKVFKEKSVTTLKKINKHNPYEEEVIYEALGTSIYEHIFPNMVLFEGKTDKDLFDAFTKKFSSDIKPLSIGSLSTDGVEKIPQYIKFIDGRFVKGYVVVDSDADGQKIKKELIKENNSITKSNIFEINDIIQVKPNATLEDLYPKDIILEVLNDKFQVTMILDDTQFNKQINEKNKALSGKINVKELKGYLVEYILSDLQKLTKDKAVEKYGLLYKFYVQLHSSIKISYKNE